MYVAGFWVGDDKRFIRSVAIRLCREIVMEGDDVVHQVPFKHLYIVSVPFTLHKLLPRTEQVFK
jgi:hypothetical protein